MSSYLLLFFANDQFNGYFNERWNTDYEQAPHEKFPLSNSCGQYGRSVSETKTEGEVVWGNEYQSNLVRVFCIYDISMRMKFVQLMNHFSAQLILQWKLLQLMVTENRASLHSHVDLP